MGTCREFWPVRPSGWALHKYVLGCMWVAIYPLHQTSFPDASFLLFQCVFQHQAIDLLLCFALMLAMDLAYPFVKNSSSIFGWSLQSTVEVQIRVHLHSVSHAISNFNLLWYLQCTLLLHFIIFYYVFVLQSILLYPFVISCVQILYSQLSFTFTQRKFWTSSASLRHQSYVKYIADVYGKTHKATELKLYLGFQSCICYIKPVRIF